MKMTLPIHALYILEQLKHFGYEAFVVGGFVRDHLLGLESNDIDVSTNASPDQILAVFEAFPHSEIGKDHGTIGVKIDESWIEITTYRVDLDYHHHRKPKGVIFTQDLKEDVLRRDFTINALAMDDQGQVLDFVGGLNDLESRTIRSVGQAHERFKEDALRILRALRFAARLDFKIESLTQAALFEDKTLLKELASERILDELTKLLESPKVNRIFQENIEVIREVLPEVVSSHHLDRLDFVGPHLRWIILFENRSVDELMFRLKALKTSNAFKKSLKSSLLCIQQGTFEDEVECKLRLLSYDYEAVLNSVAYFMDVLEMSNADQMAKQLQRVVDSKACYRLQDLAIDGQDCMRLGFRGESIKTCLENVLNEVIHNRIQNDSLDILNYIKSQLS